MSTSKTGTVKWFSKTKGYGFIEQDSGIELFAHLSSIATDGFKILQKGDKVKFEIQKSDKGLQASNIIKLQSNNTAQSSLLSLQGYLHSILKKIQTIWSN